MAGIAARAHGVVTREQLLHAGLTRHQIQDRVIKGALLLVHRGVYRVGHDAPSTEGGYLAAVLACGAGAVLGGCAAAFNYGLVKGPVPPPEVVTTTERRVPGVICRRCRHGEPITTVWNRIPTLTVPDTLVDLAASLSEDELARACHEAGVRFRTTPRQVDAALQRRANASGAAALRRVTVGETKVSLSRLESRFVALLRAEGSRSRKPTGPPEAGAWTAAGPNTG